VSFGHPNTTGIPNLDYFVSNDLFEPREAAEHYSEKLFRLHDLPTLAYYHRPAIPALESRAAALAALGLPTGKPLYVCPQTLYKVHPDMDALIRGILLRDPKGLVVLIEGQFGEFTAQLRARFAANLPEVAARIVFLRRMGFAEFLRLLAVADVILDTVHFNGMNSSLESFAVGTPIVTLPSGLQRGRHTQAMYRKMHIDDAIARSSAHYIEIAVRIATDPEYQQSLRERILSRNHVLFADLRVVQEFERFFVEAFTQSLAL
jgi:predicted O-linked N-acetylglucosamine transferase (SPINDLY family)